MPILPLGAWGVTEAGRTGWTAVTIAAVAVAALAVPVLIRIESRRSNPMLDVELPRHPVVGSAIAVVAAVGFVQLWGSSRSQPSSNTISASRHSRPGPGCCR